MALPAQLPLSLLLEPEKRNLGLCFYGIQSTSPNFYFLWEIQVPSESNVLSFTVCFAAQFEKP
jgi:hypothetical protein